MRTSNILEQGEIRLGWCTNGVQSWVFNAATC
jgi:hypothetical protein